MRQVIGAVDEVYRQLDHTRELIKKEAPGLALGGIQLSALGLTVTGVGMFLVFIAPHFG